MSTDKTIRRLTTGAVLMVAAIAATVSYVHIEKLAITHGESILPAVLLPVSIDGTVAAASLVMLAAARAGLRTPALARFMLVLSVTATLFANVAYGAPSGWMAGILAGWPAVAFVGSVEMTIGKVRRVRVTDNREPEWLPDDLLEDEPVTDITEDTEADTMADTDEPPDDETPTSEQQSGGQDSGRKPRRDRPRKPDRLDRLIAANPDMPNAELARRAGVSERTVTRRKAATKTDSEGDTPEDTEGGQVPHLASVPMRG